MKKNYVLDTGILVQSPYALFAFDENNIFLTDVSISELERLKSQQGDVGQNAREACLLLERLRTQGDLTKGVLLSGGGTFTLIVAQNMEPTGRFPQSWNLKKADNQILLAIYRYRVDCNTDLIFISNDLSMRVKANVLGFSAQEYKADQACDVAYKGRTTLHIPGNLIDEFYTRKSIACSKLNITEELFENEFVLLCDELNEKHTALGRVIKDRIVSLTFSNAHPFGVTPRNMGQLFAQEALMIAASDVPLVILKGPAGTAKTFYSLAVGLEKTYDNEREYRKILITRPNVKFDEDVGYLKGDEMEKIMPLIRPSIDNLEALLENNHADKYRDEAELADKVQELFDRGIVDAQALAYLRGRSITKTWILIDEAQNLTPLQVLGIITRAGIGSKIILAGDPNQIDTPKLDKRSNGLVYASDRMKGSALCCQLEFDPSECTRSKLAMEAAERLTPKGYHENG